MSHVELAVDGSGCWVWLGACDSKGYPNVVVPHGFPGAGASRRMKGLRVSMTLFRGIVLGTRQAHHVERAEYDCCKECVNPDHGQGLTHLEHRELHGNGAPALPDLSLEYDPDFIF